MVAVVSRRRGRTWSVGSDRLVTWIIGLVLMAWGATLAVSGLGLSHEPVGRLINVYWPLPFMALGLVGIIGRLFGRGDAFIPVAVLVGGTAIMAGHLHIGHVNGWTLVWAGLILFIGLEILAPSLRRGRRRSERWGLGDLNIGPIVPGITIDTSADTPRGGRQGWAANGPHHQLNHAIGDLRLDLSEVQLPPGESSWAVSALIGDITVLVPEGLAVDVEAEVRVGDIRLFHQRADGFARRLEYTSPGYAEAAQKVSIRASLLVGEVTVRRF